MNHNQSFLTRIFSHNIVLLVMAFLLSFGAWLLINTNSETDTTVSTRNVYDVPVTIELPDTVKSDLKLFRGGDEKVTVTVRGARAAIATLTESDIKVTSKQISKLTAAGTYTLDLTATPASLTSSFEIRSIDPSSIECLVDREMELEFNIDNKISAEFKDKDNKDNLNVDYAMSSKTVTVSGPESQVSRIASVAVVDTITSVDENYDRTITEKLNFFDENGLELVDLDMVKTDIDEIEVHISVLPIKTVNLSVTPVNGPSKGIPEISITPKTVQIAGTKSALAAIENDTISIGSLDFSKLTNTVSVQQIKITAPKDCKVVTNEKDSANGQNSMTESLKSETVKKEAEVKIDLSDYSEKIVTSKISNRIDATAYTTEFTSNNVDITLYGPADKLENISAANITAIADFTGLLDNIKNNAVSLTVPLKISLSSEYGECWVYGAYTAQVSVSKK